MARKFHFDDEDETVDEQMFHKPSHIDRLEKKKESTYSNSVYSSFQDNKQEEYMEKEGNSMKKKKKFKWRWWYYLIIAFFVLFIAFMIYIFALSNNDGPVYGSRCEGVQTISNDYINQTISKIKSENSDVKDITMEIACKQLKVDIVFKDGMNTKKAKSIAEKSVQALDRLVGKEKDKGKTYSHLFGYENNVAQFEVNLFLESENSKDFPIYATKNVISDEFSYTLSSIKDKDSYEKAKDTLKDK